MGYDMETPLFHGTDKNFKEFKPSKRGRFGPGVYTFEGSTGEAVGQASGYGKNTLELRGPGNKNFNANGMQTLDELNALKKELEGLGLRTDGKDISELEQKLQSGKKIYWNDPQDILQNAIEKTNGEYMGHTTTEPYLKDWLLKNGYGSISGPLNDTPVKVLLDPKKIRSVDAAYDPRFKKSGLIMAGSAGLLPRLVDDDK